jgi:flagellar biogenesis protein FliO
MTTPATSASAVALPFKPAEDPGLPSGLALVLCAMALGAALYLLRRRGGKLAVGWKRQGGLLDVVESRALGPQAQLHIVRYGGRQLLLSVGPTGTQCLRDDPIDAGATP